MRLLILASSLSILAVLPACAQEDAFSSWSDTTNTGLHVRPDGTPEDVGAYIWGVNTDRSTPRGATTGWIGAPGLQGATLGSHRLCPHDFRKGFQFQMQMDAALKKGNLSDFALNAYRLYDVSGDEGYKILADLATGEMQPTDLEWGQLEGHLVSLKELLTLQGKSDSYYIQILQRLGQKTFLGAGKLAVARCDMLLDAAQIADEKCLASMGLRRFYTPLLRVHLESGNTWHDMMMSQCLKRALTRVCEATKNALAFTFVADDSDANLHITFSDQTFLWYDYQTHGTSTICEPIAGGPISEVRMKVPAMATLHRKVTEHECQEYLLRELTHALGYAWHPASMETFTRDFRDEMSAAGGSSQQQRSTKLIADNLSRLTGPALTREYVQLACHSENADFYYYGGLAYLSKGDREMARRYLCNATSLLNGSPDLLHSVVNRFIGAGDAASAELIVFACISDDDSGSTHLPAYSEYKRIKSIKGGSIKDPLPNLSTGDAQIIERIYSAGKNTPAVTATNK